MDLEEKKYALSLLSLVTIVVCCIYIFRHLMEMLQIFLLVYVPPHCSV